MTELVLGEARVASGVVLVDWLDLQRITLQLVSAHGIENYELDSTNWYECVRAFLVCSSTQKCSSE